MMNMANTALVLINFQSAWRNQSSDYYLEHFESLIPQAQKLLDHARDMQYKIIFIKHIDPHGPFSEKDENSEIIPELIPQREISVLIIKHFLLMSSRGLKTLSSAESLPISV